ncbi:phage major capsid protein [Actinomycetaceae bacterium MB13-C1-2]|nr:phage major capsid protein [Actinomycetaceae bacterium MB13-C1-2]
MAKSISEVLAGHKAAAQAIVDKATAENRDMTDAEMKSFDEIMEKHAADVAAKERDEAMAKKLAFLNEPTPSPTQPDDAPAKSLGDHFVKALGSRSLKEPGTFAPGEFKAASDVQTVGGSGLGAPYGPLLTDVDKSFVHAKRERLVVADLMGSGTVSGNAITYPVFGVLEGGAGFVGEAGQKPQMHVASPTWVTDALGEVAGFFTLSDDMAEDLDYVVSEINSTAIYDLRAKEEAALLGGNGTSPNLRGVLNRSGIQTATQGADSVQDAIFKALTKVEEATDFTADGIVINPADYEALRLSKDSNGQYFGGGFFAGQYGAGDILVNPPLWGRKTVVTNAVAAGTVVVGAWAQAAKVFRKGGLRVESTNSHADDFTNDRITVRVRERLGLQVKYPAAFVKLTLDTEG